MKKNRILIVLCIMQLTNAMEPEPATSQDPMSTMQKLISALQQTNPHITRHRLSLHKLMNKINRHKDDVNAIDQSSGNSALHLLAQLNLGHLGILWAQKLLALKADPNARNKNSDTPLHFAINTGHLAFAQLMLKHNALLNPINSQGQTPLHLLCANPRFVACLNAAVHECRLAIDPGVCKYEVLTIFFDLTGKKQVPRLTEFCARKIATLSLEQFKYIVQYLESDARNRTYNLEKIPEKHAGRLLEMLKELNSDACARLPQFPFSLTLERLRTPAITEQMSMENELLFSDLETNILQELHDSLKLDRFARFNAIDHQNVYRSTALHEAVRNGACYEILRILVRLGASRIITTGNDGSKTAALLFNGVNCACKKCRDITKPPKRRYTKEKLLLSYPSHAMEQIQSIIDLRHELLDQAPTPATITPRATIFSSPRTFITPRTRSNLVNE